ncbi:MAG TPA: hypothetical protein PLJ21_12295 [Pseudobdellovibrionaceae bacterium]|nr:hypothetical protein [Pseudobdellovibrionaceae bacterium]
MKTFSIIFLSFAFFVGVGLDSEARIHWSVGNDFEEERPDNIFYKDPSGWRDFFSKTLKLENKPDSEYERLAIYYDQMRKKSASDVRIENSINLTVATLTCSTGNTIAGVSALLSQFPLLHSVLWFTFAEKDRAERTSFGTVLLGTLPESTWILLKRLMGKLDNEDANKELSIAYATSTAIADDLVGDKTYCEEYYNQYQATHHLLSKRTTVGPKRDLN